MVCVLDLSFTIYFVDDGRSTHTTISPFLEQMRKLYKMRRGVSSTDIINKIATVVKYGVKEFRAVPCDDDRVLVAGQC